jgi:hypothetical protein
MTPGARKKAGSNSRRTRAQASIIKKILLMELKLGRPPSTMEIERDYPRLAKQIQEFFENGIADVRIAVAIEQVRLDEKTASRL